MKNVRLVLNSNSIRRNLSYHSGVHSWDKDYFSVEWFRNDSDEFFFSYRENDLPAAYEFGYFYWYKDASIIKSKHETEEEYTYPPEIQLGDIKI